RALIVTGVQTCALPISWCVIFRSPPKLACLIGSGVATLSDDAGASLQQRFGLLLLEVRDPQRLLVLDVDHVAVKFGVGVHHDLRSEEHTSELQSRSDLV